MADTALTIITDCLTDLGVLADGETPTSSQATGGLRKLNNLIDSYSLMDLLVYGSTQYILPMVPGKGSYTIGTGGDLNIPRPNSITSVFTRDLTQPVNNQTDDPVYMFNDDEWQNVRFKGQTAQYPFMGIWFNMTYPLITAYVNPIPTSSQYSIVFWTNGALNDLNLNDVISLAPGYKRMLTANLGQELAASYGVPVPDPMARVAKESKDTLMTQNLQIDTLSLGSLGGGWYDIRTGQIR